jgi:hypothetical protein
MASLVNFELLGDLDYFGNSKAVFLNRRAAGRYRALVLLKKFTGQLSAKV